MVRGMTRLKNSLLVVLLVVAMASGMFACSTPPKEQASTSPVASQTSAPGQTPSQQPSSSTPSQPGSSQPSTTTHGQTPSQQHPSSAPSSTPAPEPSPSESATITGDLVVRFLDVGQGDAIFISLPHETCMLIDAGARSAGEDVVAAIKGLGETTIDYAIFTHPHEDHIGGAPAVFDAFDIKEVWMPRTSHPTQAYENLLLAIEREGLMVDEAKAGKVIIDEGNLKAWLLSPGKVYDNLNNMSAVVALTYGGRTLIFEGDAEGEAEAAMTLGSSVQLPDCDVLKVAHHGSSSSSTVPFLELISPEITVISVGAGNGYGHPAQSTLDRLAAQGAEVYRTDVHGTVTVTTDGTSLEVKTEKAPEPTEATVPAVPIAPTPSSEDITVYITKTGSKYHRDGCRYSSESKIPITLKDAKARGYGPCSVCKAPT